MIARLLGASWAGYAIAGGVALALLVGAYAQGYGHAARKWEARYAARETELVTAQAAEIERQTRANDTAKRVEAARILALSAANDAMQTKIEELARDADTDPDRDRACLGADSVRRIAKIRD